MTEPGETAEPINELILKSVKEDEAETRYKAPRWHRHVALSTLLALLTAVGALLAGITTHKSVMNRTEELINISIAKNNQTNIEVLSAKVDILASLNKPLDMSDMAAFTAYQKAAEALEEKVSREAIMVQEASSAHLFFAIAVTILSIGITMNGMAVIINQKFLWTAGLAFGAVGTIGVSSGIFTMLS